MHNLGWIGREGNGKETVRNFCTKSDLYELDQISLSILQHLKHQSDRNFERTNFVFRITSMSKIKGQEKLVS